MRSNLTYRKALLNPRVCRRYYTAGARDYYTHPAVLIMTSIEVIISAHCLRTHTEISVATLDYVL